MKTMPVILILCIIATGCTLPTQPPNAPTPDIAASVTAAVAQTARPIPEISPTTTPAPYKPIYVHTWADNVLLRSSPGYLFPRLRVLAKGTALLVQGQAPGGEWLSVQTPDNLAGWVFRALVETSGDDMSLVPLVEPPGVMEIRGHVADPAGYPISDIQYTFTQGSGTNPPRNDARTDQTGIFHAYMPLDTSSTWWVAYTAIGCESNIVDEQCLWSGTSEPKGMYIQLPQEAGQVIEFVWK
jgi:hypothetical protein